MRMFSQKVAAFLLVALCLLGGQVAIAAGGVTVTAVSGTVNSTSDNKPIPALVYVNGKSAFANKATGAFTLAGNPLVPPLSVGQTLTLRVLATGYAPILKVLTVTSAQLTSGKFSGLKIAMKPVALGKPLTVAATFKAATEKGYFVVNGTVKSGSTPVCAVVWANGKAMLSCQKDAVGTFSLKGKLSSTGKVALKVFPVSTTYRTYSYTTPDTDKDGTANFMDRDDDNDGLEDGLDLCPLDINPACIDTDRDGKPDTVDTDDDNDGILDVNDSCPLNAELECKLITDTITANGKVWAQVSLFTNLSWNDINAVCPTGLCNGILKGYDMNGWTWASVEDVNTLINYYGMDPPMGPGPDTVYSSPEPCDVGNFGPYTCWYYGEVIGAFFADGWHLTLDVSNTVRGESNIEQFVWGLSRDVYYDQYSLGAGVGTSQRFPFFNRTFQTSAQYLRNERYPTTGGWFFKKP